MSNDALSFSNINSLAKEELKFINFESVLCFHLSYNLLCGFDIN